MVSPNDNPSKNQSSELLPGDKPPPPTVSPFRERIHEIIFGADDFAGALFDVVLLILIVASIVVVCLDTVPDIGRTDDPKVPGPYHGILSTLSWTFTIIFTAEYLLRLYCVRRPLRYVFSFWGIIDLLSFMPDYLLVGFSGRQGMFTVIRSLRLLRAFRIFKLGWFQNEAEDLGNAVWRSRAKITVFITVVMILVTVSGTLMYEIETWRGVDIDDPTGGSSSQFESIPDGIYWAIVTMTTVGYGDIVPTTTLGKILSAVLILIGYSLIIVPTGFVSAEIIGHKKGVTLSNRSCLSCLATGHDDDALYCKLCGKPLAELADVSDSETIPDPKT
ncbi:ion transporter [Mariniblastus sp.]|nr:ion transporter [Mariniblastus sp.]